MNKITREIYKFECNGFYPRKIKELSSSFETFDDLLKDRTSFIHDFKINSFDPECYSINTQGKDLVFPLSRSYTKEIHLMGHHRDGLRKTNHCIYIGTLDKDIPELDRWNEEQWIGICKKDPQYEYINCPVNDYNLMIILKRLENRMFAIEKDISAIKHRLDIY